MSPNIGIPNHEKLWESQTRTGIFKIMLNPILHIYKDGLNRFLRNQEGKYKRDYSKLGSTQQWMALTCCQDHILTENIWFVWSETSYSGDERRCYRCGTTMNEQTHTEDRATQPMEAGGWVSQYFIHTIVSHFKSCHFLAFPRLSICTIGHQITIKHTINFIDVDTVGKVRIAWCPAETEGLPILQLYKSYNKNPTMPIQEVYHISIRNVAL